METGRCSRRSFERVALEHAAGSISGWHDKDLELYERFNGKMFLNYLALSCAVEVIPLSESRVNNLLRSTMRNRRQKFVYELGDFVERCRALNTQLSLPARKVPT